jgi:uncharacterized protein (TIGR02284 family)
MASSEHTKHLVIMLNDLAIINKDRIEGYKKAEKQVGERSDLCSLFREKFNQSEEFVNDLQLQIKTLGGNHTVDASFAGKIFRAWMSIKNTFKPNDATSVLDSCAFGETAAINAYDEVLRSDVEIPASVRQQILEQQTAIKKSYDMIKKYGDLNLNFFNYNKSFTS